MPGFCRYVVFLCKKDSTLSTCVSKASPKHATQIKDSKFIFSVKNLAKYFGNETLDKQREMLVKEKNKIVD